MSGHASWVLGVAFSPDGNSFVSGSSDKTVKVWELKSRQCVHTFSEHTDQVGLINRKLVVLNDRVFCIVAGLEC